MTEESSPEWLEGQNKVLLPASSMFWTVLPLTRVISLHTPEPGAASWLPPGL